MMGFLIYVNRVVDVNLLYVFGFVFVCSNYDIKEVLIWLVWQDVVDIVDKSGDLVSLFFGLLGEELYLSKN